MTKLDFYWSTNKAWYHIDENCDFVIHDDAPEEAKKSFENYKRQLKEKAKTGAL